ncbi:MAG: hypothetical protein CME06_04050 [Gemmatimonadetes bacterium]|nr:hypothetical protein [Gemmatimonadota bacterium]
MRGQLLLLLAAGSVARVEAATIQVPGDYERIQDAIDAASDGDEVIIALGTYVESMIDFRGKAITVHGPEPGVGIGETQPVVDGGGAGSVFLFQSAEPAEAKLAHLTIRGGNAENGGGIRCEQASPTIEHCTIENNSALAEGGGFTIGDDESHATLVDCLIAENQAEYAGGGVYGAAEATPTFMSRPSLPRNPERVPRPAVRPHVGA